MRNYFIISAIFFLNVFIYNACNMSKKNKSSINSTCENFDLFIKRFKKEQKFQEKHISDSLRLVSIDYYENKVEIKRLDKIKFPLYPIVEVKDKYNWEVKQKNDTFFLSQKGIDNGIYVVYKFIKLDSCWSLFEIIDESD